MIDSPLSRDNQRGESPPPARTRVTLPARLASAVLKHPLQAAAFWGAVALPLVYVPLLAFGLDTNFRAQVFVGLLALHVLALFLGRSYSVE